MLFDLELFLIKIFSLSKMFLKVFKRYFPNLSQTKYSSDIWYIVIKCLRQHGIVFKFNSTILS